MRYLQLFIWILAAAFASCAHEGTPRRDTRSLKAGATSSDTTSTTNTPIDSATTPTPTVGAPIIWMVGGWNSCNGTANDPTPTPRGMNAFKNFGPMYEDLKKRLYPGLEYYASCLKPDIIKAHIIHSDNPQDMVIVDREMAISLVAKRAAEKNAPLVIIGHSYGGWMSMISTQMKIEAPIKLLLTMDPISAVTCTSAVMSEMVQMKFGQQDPFASPAGCITSPTDISESQRNTVRANVARWVNLWQIDTLNVLHATPIAQAENEQIFQDPIYGVNGHINMGLNPDVWKKIEAYVEASLR